MAAQQLYTAADRLAAAKIRMADIMTQLDGATAATAKGIGELSSKDFADQLRGTMRLRHQVAVLGELVQALESSRLVAETTLLYGAPDV